MKQLKTVHIIPLIFALILVLQSCSNATSRETIIDIWKAEKESMEYICQYLDQYQCKRLTYVYIGETILTENSDGTTGIVFDDEFCKVKDYLFEKAGLVSIEKSKNAILFSFAPNVTPYPGIAFSLDEKMPEPPFQIETEHLSGKWYYYEEI